MSASDIMDHFDENRSSPAPTLGTPCRGIVMWSFASKNLDEVYRRAQAAGIEILSSPDELSSPFLSSTKTLLLKDPGEFPIEICQI